MDLAPGGSCKGVRQLEQSTSINMVEYLKGRGCELKLAMKMFNGGRRLYVGLDDDLLKWVRRGCEKEGEEEEEEGKGEEGEGDENKTDKIDFGVFFHQKPKQWAVPFVFIYHANSEWKVFKLN